MFIEKNHIRVHASASMSADQGALDASPGDNILIFSTGRYAREQRFKIAQSTGAPKIGSRKLLFCALFLSAAAHGGGLATALMGDPGEQFGTVSEKSDTFSLSMEQSVVLESIANESSKTAAAAAAASQAGSVQAVESKPQELAETANEALSDDPPPKPIKVADVTPASLSPTDEPLPIVRGGGEPDAVSEVKADTITDVPVTEMPDTIDERKDSPAKMEKKKEIDKEKKSPQKESHQQVAGSALSRANSSTAMANGRVSASRGNALTYGAQVRAKLMKAKPMPKGLRGSVVVSFGITETGTLRYLRLSQSSGTTLLDNMAIGMVEKAAPFDEPPAELTAAQLSYAISINFFN